MLIAGIASHYIYKDHKFVESMNLFKNLLKFDKADSIMPGV